MDPNASGSTRRKGPIGNWIVRVVLCVVSIVLVLAVLALVRVPHDRLLSAALNLFLTVVLVASIRWGTRYAILLSVLSALGFSLLLPPVGHLHFADGRVWTLLTACLVTGVVASQLSRRARNAILEANQRRAEAQAEQQRFADLVNSVEGVVWEANADSFVFSFVSEQAERVLGYPSETWVNEATFWKDHLHPNDREWAVQVRVKAAAEKCNQDSEYRMIAADGRVVWIRDLVNVVVENARVTHLRGVMIDISKRKQAEESARRSENELRQLIEQVPAMVWSAKPDGSNITMNRRWAEYTGQSAEQTAGLGWQAAVHPDDLGRHMGVFRASAAAGSRFEDEIRFRRTDGTYRWFVTTGVPLQDDQGNIVKWYGIVTDIEDRKRAEQALRESERNLAEAQKLTHTGSFIWDVRTGAALHVSDEWYRIYGFEEESGPRIADADTEVNGVVPLAFYGPSSWEERLKRIHPDDRSKWQAAVDQAIEKKADYELEFRIVLPDRRIRHLYAVGHPVLNDCGDLIQFMGSVTDITDRKRAEDALRRSQAYLAEAQRLTHTGSWAWDPESDNMLYWSEEMFHIFGLDPGQGLPGREKFVDRVHPEDRDRVYEHVWRAVSQKMDYVVDHRILLRDGTVKHIQRIGHPLCSGSDNKIEYVGTAMDVTERKRIEEEREKLHQLEADLARINRMTAMGELTASLAHEINQPIAAAVTNANTSVRWLGNEVPNIEEAREAAKRAANDATRAAEIINRIRSLFKKGEAQRELVNVNEAIDEIVALVSNQAVQSGVSIRSELAADLPQVTADRVQLQQVVMNLMLNSIDAMKNVEGTREIVLRSHLDAAGQVLISVSDTGVGLPPEVRQIFDAFFTTKSQGTGMGLTISRTIIESHGGRLWASSNSGHGATFSFTLPSAAEVHV